MKSAKCSNHVCCIAVYVISIMINISCLFIHCKFVYTLYFVNITLEGEDMGQSLRPSMMR